MANRLEVGLLINEEEKEELGEREEGYPLSGRKQIKKRNSDKKCWLLRFQRVSKKLIVSASESSGGEIKELKFKREINDRLPQLHLQGAGAATGEWIQKPQAGQLGKHLKAESRMDDAGKELWHPNGIPRENCRRVEKSE